MQAKDLKDDTTDRKQSQNSMQDSNSFLNTGAIQAQITPDVRSRMKLSKEWQIVVQRYKLQKIIGKGASGLVVKAKDNVTSKTVAIKHMKSGFKEGYHYVIKRTLSEVMILRHLTQMQENVHTVKVQDILVSDDLTDIFIVMNYVSNDLKNAIKSNPNGVSEEQITTILFKLLCGLNFIHKANIMHRDLKPGNILIDQDLTLQICDFGLARTSRKPDSKKKEYTREAMTKKLISVRGGRRENKREMSNHVVTRSYRPPEVIILEKRYKNSVDIWSAGCVLAEIMFDQDVYRDQGMQRNRPLFNGKYCEPLSPASSHDSHGNDQMQKIMKVLGSLDEQDVSFVTEPDVVDQLLKTFHKNSEKLDLTNTFPQTHSDIIAILQNMLEFNPYFRKKPEQLLKHSIFDQMKQQFPEFLVPPSKQIFLCIDQKKSFNYETSKFNELSIEDLKNLLLKEVEIIQNLKQEQ